MSAARIFERISIQAIFPRHLDFFTPRPLLEHPELCRSLLRGRLYLLQFRQKIPVRKASDKVTLVHHLRFIHVNLMDDPGQSARTFAFWIGRILTRRRLSDPYARGK